VKGGTRGSKERGESTGEGKHYPARENQEARGEKNLGTTPSVPGAEKKSGGKAEKGEDHHRGEAGGGVMTNGPS